MEWKPESLPKLFDAVKAKFPASLDPESWYLVAASAIVTCSDPLQFGQLYTYLTNQPEVASPERRRFLNNRFREVLFKQWVNIGVPKVAIALFGLIKEEQEGDANLSFTKEHIHLDAANREKGTDFLNSIYGPDRTDNMFKSWGANFEWLTKDVVYGMFFADSSVLDSKETELICYTAIVCQSLPVQIHLGGLQRMGLSLEEIEGVTECAKLVAKWAGCDLGSWPHVRAVAASLNANATPVDSSVDEA